MPSQHFIRIPGESTPLTVGIVEWSDVAAIGEYLATSLAAIGCVAIACHNTFFVCAADGVLEEGDGNDYWRIVVDGLRDRISYLCAGEMVAVTLMCHAIVRSRVIPAKWAYAALAGKEYELMSLHVGATAAIAAAEAGDQGAAIRDWVADLMNTPSGPDGTDDGTPHGLPVVEENAA